MTGTIKKIITFSITFLVLFLSFNFLYTHYINSSRAIYRTELEFRQYKENIKILFLGDSHPAYAFNPDAINNSFNYATTAENYARVYFKLRKILNEENSIDIIVLPLEPESLSNYTADPY